MPGMPYYDATRAEEVFCTEAEIRAAGYRRAMVKMEKLATKALQNSLNCRADLLGVPYADETEHLREEGVLSIRRGGACRCSIVRAGASDLPLRPLPPGPPD